MEPITAAIIAALTAGAASGLTEATKKAINDGYSGLKALISKKLAGKGDIIDAIGKLEAKPESPGRQQTLDEELKAANASADPELSAAAQSLLELIKAMPHGEQHIQNAVGTGIAQADRGSTASVCFAVFHLRGTTVSVEPAAQSAQGRGIAQAYGPGATASVTIGLTP